MPKNQTLRVGQKRQRKSEGEAEKQVGVWVLHMVPQTL